MIILFFVLLGILGFFFDKEDDLQDVARIRFFNQAFESGTIVIEQPAPGAPLEAGVPEFDQLEPADQNRFGKETWRRMRRQVFRFVAAVNQGLGDPFEYNETDGRAVVKKIKENTLKYSNPFEITRRGSITTPINSSEAVAKNRPGWRIVSRNLILYLKPGAEARTIDPGEQFACEVGGEFTLGSRSGGSRAGANVTLRIHLESQGDLQGLKLEPQGALQNPTRPSSLNTGSISSGMGARSRYTERTRKLVTLRIRQWVILFSPKSSTDGLFVCKCWAGQRRIS